MVHNSQTQAPASVTDRSAAGVAALHVTCQDTGPQEPTIFFPVQPHKYRLSPSSRLHKATDLVLMNQDVHPPAAASTTHASAAGVAAHSQVRHAAVSTDRGPGTGNVGQLSMQPVVTLKRILQVGNT
jgi:hypothetical protein